MIGFYDYTVITSFLGIISAVIGMTEACNGNFLIAIICLAFSGMCDTLDGKIARTKKNRTDDEKAFGIQLDSLCDVVCFGVFPVVIAYNMGMNKPLGIAVLCMFLVCGVIRLAYFNITTGKKGSMKFYNGLPVTSTAIIYPVLGLLYGFINMQTLSIIYIISTIIIAFLFVYRFQVQKFDKLAYIIVPILAIVLIWMLLIIR